MTREPSPALTPGPAAAAVPPAPAPAAGTPAARGQLSSLWRAMRHLEGRRLWIGLGLLVLGTLSEGAAIMTFLPVLQLVGAQGTTIDLSGMDFPGAGLLPAMIPLGVLLLVIVGQLVLTRTVFSTAVTHTLPSPGSPVRAEVTMTSTRSWTSPSSTTVSMRTFSSRSTVYSAPR